MKFVKHILTTLFCFSFFVSVAQDYPQGYFKFPIKPGQQGFLAGTFGELRSNHFHSGIDIKTGGQEGLNVYAAADGHVSRIKIGRKGYGKALYIDHPNGYTTVYAHLKNYNTEIDSIIRAVQYQNKSFEVNFFPQKGAIKIKKGQVIAKSGNTGGSMGPHLHFEIRNTKQEPINPLLFGFNEIKDKVPPTINNLALTPLSIHSRINGEFEEPVFPLTSLGNGQYQLSENDTIFVEGAFHLNLDAIDKLNGVPNKNGIYTLQIAVDDTTFYNLEVDKFSFAHTRMINEHINYRLYKSVGKRFYKIFYNTKNRLGFYNSFTDRGILHFHDFKAHHISINCSDAYGNTSTLKFIVQNSTIPTEPYSSKKSTSVESDIINNTMRITLPAKTETPITSHSLNKEISIFPAYKNNNSTIYLIDLTSELPKYISQDSVLVNFPYLQQVTSNNGYAFNYKKLQIDFPKNATYSTMYLTVKNDSNTVIIGDANMPLYKNITVKNEAIKKTTHPYMSTYSIDSDGKLEHETSWWENDNLLFKTRSLGEYVYLQDSLPPIIKASTLNNNQVSFVIEDNLSGIDKIKATINNQWLLMNYDYKTGKIWSEAKNKNQKLIGDLSIEITDKQGNITTFAKKLP